MDKENERITEELVALWKREYPNSSPHFPRCHIWREVELSVDEIKHHAPKDKVKAMQYEELMRKGEVFPPIVVLAHTMGLIDGYHRLWGHKRAHKGKKIRAYLGSRK